MKFSVGLSNVSRLSIKKKLLYMKDARRKYFLCNSKEIHITRRDI
jgi:hypothetical protein